MVNSNHETLTLGVIHLKQSTDSFKCDSAYVSWL